MSGPEFSDQIPYYLTRDKGEALMKQLRNFSEKTPIYLKDNMEGLLQGDGWTGLSILDHGNGTVRTARAVILSNSCDISLANKREVPPFVSYAPLWRLSNLERVFLDSGISAQAVADKIGAIRRQEVTQFFFLPSQGVLDDDYVVWLSNAQSMPLANFDSSANTRLFTLNMVGFYYFVFKISVHFCRFFEEVDRDDAG